MIQRLHQRRMPGKSGCYFIHKLFLASSFNQALFVGMLWNKMKLNAIFRVVNTCISAPVCKKPAFNSNFQQVSKYIGMFWMGNNWIYLNKAGYKQGKTFNSMIAFLIYLNLQQCHGDQWSVISVRAFNQTGLIRADWHRKRWLIHNPEKQRASNGFVNPELTLKINLQTAHGRK